MRLLLVSVVALSLPPKTITRLVPTSFESEINDNNYHTKMMMKMDKYNDGRMMAISKHDNSRMMTIL